MGYIRGLLGKLMPVLKGAGAAIALFWCVLMVYLGAVLMARLGEWLPLP